MNKSKDPTPYDLLQVALKELKTPEEKLESVTNFMREALAQKGVPRFRDFWEARKLFHEIFKECKDAILKSTLWEKLSQMTTEARQIKEILDEQSTFAIEQIEIAIQALAKDVEAGARHIAGKLSIPKECKTLLRKERLYSECHAQVQFLTTQLDRLKELRQEVIRTEMRIKHKNRLLKELSSIGDKFIPKRKELIAEVSEQFLRDVRFFVSKNFGEGERRLSPHVLRKEIQGFQAMAKQVPLGAKVFKETRDELAGCWEQLKKWSDEKRAEYEENKELYDQNLEEIKPFADAFIELTTDVEKPSRKQIDVEHEKVIEKLRAAKLDGKARHTLFKQVDAAHDKWVAARKEIDEEKRQAAKRAKAEKIARFEQEVATIEEKSCAEMQKLIEELEAEAGELFVTLCDTAKVALLRKRQQEISSSEEIASLIADWEQIEGGLRRKLERLRKASGGSGFDFEKAMEYRHQIDEAKKTLEQAEEAIESLQSKL